MKFDILVQNNASKEFYVISGLENTSSTGLYIRFNDVELPDGMQDGEYTYAVIKDEDGDAIFTPKTPIQESIVTIDGKQMVLKELNPLTGLMRVGKVETNDVYDDGHISFPYDAKKDNNTLYYEG